MFGGSPWNKGNAKGYEEQSPLRGRHHHTRVDFARHRRPPRPNHRRLRVAARAQDNVVTVKFIAVPLSAQLSPRRSRVRSPTGRLGNGETAGWAVDPGWFDADLLACGNHAAHYLIAADFEPKKTGSANNRRRQVVIVDSLNAERIMLRAGLTRTQHSPLPIHRDAAVGGCTV